MTDSQLYFLMDESPEKGQKALFEEYCGYVYAIVARRLKSCGTNEDIEESVADCFAAVFQYLDSQRSHDGELRGIIGTIAKRTAINYFRKLSLHSGKTVSIEEKPYSDISSEQNIEKNAELTEMRRELLRAVDSLGKPDSAIIIQYYFYGRTSAHIGASLHMTDGSVQKRIQRARKKLKKILTEAGIEMDGEL